MWSQEWSRWTCDPACWCSRIRKRRKPALRDMLPAVSLSDLSRSKKKQSWQCSGPRIIDLAPDIRQTHMTQLSLKQ
ncbi:hypothetical protein AGR1B_Cc130021 [Agrobacterium fabacearum S56]|nr:hypothetical protein AGR1B_Cc130021 [Agrobacterium fabacearum S56]